MINIYQSFNNSILAAYKQSPNKKRRLFTKIRESTAYLLIQSCNSFQISQGIFLQIHVFYFQVKTFVSKAYNQLSIFHAIFEDFLRHWSQSSDEKSKIVKKVKEMVNEIAKLKRQMPIPAVSYGVLLTQLFSIGYLLQKLKLQSVCESILLAKLGIFFFFFLIAVISVVVWLNFHETGK